MAARSSTITPAAIPAGTLTRSAYQTLPSNPSTTAYGSGAAPARRPHATNAPMMPRSSITAIGNGAIPQGPVQSGLRDGPFQQAIGLPPLADGAKRGQRVRCQCPLQRGGLRRQTHPRQGAHPVDHAGPAQVRIAPLRPTPQIDHAGPGPLNQTQVKPGQLLAAGFGPQPLTQSPVRIRPEFARQCSHRKGADPTVQAAPVPLKSPPVGIAPAAPRRGACRRPVLAWSTATQSSSRSSSRARPDHHTARHVMEPVQLGCIVRRQHDPRLPRVATGTLDKRVRSNAPAVRAVQRAGTAVRLDAVSPEIPEMGAGIGGPGRTETAQPDNAATLAGSMKPAATAHRVFDRPPAQVPERLDAAQEGCRGAALTAEPRRCRRPLGTDPRQPVSEATRSRTSRPARSDAGVGPWYRPSNDLG